jgi:hypothetical protein
MKTISAQVERIVYETGGMRTTHNVAGANGGTCGRVQKSGLSARASSRDLANGIAARGRRCAIAIAGLLQTPLFSH